jgi:hypothetical protein
LTQNPDLHVVHEKGQLPRVAGLLETLWDLESERFLHHYLLASKVKES